MNIAIKFRGSRAGAVLSAIHARRKDATKFFSFGDKGLIRALLLLSAFAVITQVAQAQDAGSNAGQLWKSSRTAFGSGDFVGSAKDLESIIKGSALATQLRNGPAPKIPPTQAWLEPVFFMLGVSYFNAKDWDQATSVFDKYLQLFPTSPHIAQVTFSLAQAYLQAKKPESAEPLLASLLSNRDYHSKALLLLVGVYKKSGKVAQAITLLEKETALPNLEPDFAQSLNMNLVTLYLQSQEEDKAVAALKQLDANITYVENVTDFNAAAVQLGDSLLTKKNIDGALGCYRRVRDNQQIIVLQKLRITRLQRQKNATFSRIQADPLNSYQLQLDTKDIAAQIARDERVLTQYADLPPVLPPLFLRIAQAYTSASRYWESAAVYREIQRRYPQSVEAEPALYGQIVVFDRLKQNDRALDLGESYLKQYPNGKYAESVGFLRGALAYDSQDFDKAVAYFQDCLDKYPKNPRREQIELILGDIKLRQQKFDEAIACYQRYEKDYPEGSQLEKAEYRTALALLFAGKTDDANGAFQAYLNKHPSGTYVADAEYRLDVIKFAANKYDEVLADCAAWEKKHGTNGPYAEVLSLEGDCYASQNKNDEAIETYTRAYKAAQTTEVLNYAIFAAAKLLQKEAKWPEIVGLFQEFIKNNPDHPTVVSAVSWIGRAEIKLGKIDEAKAYLADTAKQFLNDPAREAVDEILTQLAQLYSHKHLAPPPPALVGSPAVAPGIAASQTAPSPVNKPEEELANILAVPDMNGKSTAQARVSFAKAEFFRFQHKTEVEAGILLDIAKQFKPEDLSPLILGQVGDCLMQNGQFAQAEPFYSYLFDQYKDSPLVDYAYNGLAQVAYQKRDYKEADRYYAKALEKGLGASKLKDLTLGEAQTLLALNRPNEAKPLFEQVASNRAWRGEDTALSVFSLGQVAMDLGDVSSANAYYQRVFVAYQKYPSIQAKAYLKSGEAFEKLGKIPEAINTYSEMLRNPNLSTFPETSEAKQRLQQLAQK